MDFNFIVSVSRSSLAYKRRNLIAINLFIRFQIATSCIKAYMYFIMYFALYAQKQWYCVEIEW